MRSAYQGVRWYGLRAASLSAYSSSDQLAGQQHYNLTYAHGRITTPPVNDATGICTVNQAYCEGKGVDYVGTEQTASYTSDGQKIAEMMFGKTLL